MSPRVTRSSARRAANQVATPATAPTPATSSTSNFPGSSAAAQPQLQIQVATQNPLPSSTSLPPSRKRKASYRDGSSVNGSEANTLVSGPRRASKRQKASSSTSADPSPAAHIPAQQTSAAPGSSSSRRRKGKAVANMASQECVNRSKESEPALNSLNADVCENIGCLRVVHQTLQMLRPLCLAAAGPVGIVRFPKMFQVPKPPGSPCSLQFSLTVFFL